MSAHRAPHARVAVVTGATGGIGSAVAAALARDGFTLALTYRANADRAIRLAEDVRATGSDARVYQADLADLEAAAGLARQVADDLGRVDALVHCAGPHVPMQHLSTVSPAQFARQCHEEGTAFFALVHAFLPMLRESSGSITAVTSAATRRYPVRDGLSAAPKATVEGLVRAFAAEEGRFGIRANSVGPGMLTDGMAERLMGNGDLDERALGVMRSNIPMRRFGRAADVAEAVAFLVSDRAGYISGQKLDIDGGYGG